MQKFICVSNQSRVVSSHFFKVVLDFRNRCPFDSIRNKAEKRDWRTDYWALQGTPGQHHHANPIEINSILLKIFTGCIWCWLHLYYGSRYLFHPFFNMINLERFQINVLCQKSGRNEFTRILDMQPRKQEMEWIKLEASRSLLSSCGCQFSSCCKFPGRLCLEGNSIDESGGADGQSTSKNRELIQ